MNCAEVDSTLYTKLCDETVELRKEHYLKQLEYVRSLRANHTNTKVLGPSVVLKCAARPEGLAFGVHSPVICTFLGASPAFKTIH